MREDDIMAWHTAKLNEARADLLERVRSEVIGSDDVWNGALKAMQTRVVVRNSLRNEQRSALQKIEEPNHA